MVNIWFLTDPAVQGPAEEHGERSGGTTGGRTQGNAGLPSHHYSDACLFIFVFYFFGFLARKDLK